MPQGQTLLFRDDNRVEVQLMKLSSPQVIAVNGSAGAAVLTAAISKGVVRLHPSSDIYILPTVATAVTSSTGHFLAAGGCYDIPIGVSNTKISMLAVGTAAATCYLSELG